VKSVVGRPYTHFISCQRFIVLIALLLAMFVYLLSSPLIGCRARRLLQLLAVTLLLTCQLSEVDAGENRDWVYELMNYSRLSYILPTAC